MSRKLMTLSLGLATVPSLARAECMGSCKDGLVAALASIAVYGVIGIVLLVMLIRAKWRRAGLIGLGAVALLALGVPMVSQGWQAWKLHRMEEHEIVGTLPEMAGRLPLMITSGGTCDYSACAAVLLGRGNAGVHVLPLEALEGIDLTQAHELADLPLEFWAEAMNSGGETQRKVLTPEERIEVVGLIDYLIISPFTFYRAEAGAIEAGLRANPVIGGLKDGVLVEMLMAPFDPARQVLDLPDLVPDYLDLTLMDRALAFPLAPLNHQAAGNSTVGIEDLARSICPVGADGEDGMCRALLER